jgi:hypothetical protein
MRRKLIVMLMTLVGYTCVASTALAAPNADRASCQAILTTPDAHSQIRDTWPWSSPHSTSRPVRFTGS